MKDTGFGFLKGEGIGNFLAQGFEKIWFGKTLAFERWFGLRLLITWKMLVNIRLLRCVYTTLFYLYKDFLKYTRWKKYLYKKSL